ncbi:hypothetical protein MJO28_014763 [Puccinia striiformis f. sp. tritici]|uniref:Uncharacterized protein n=1 Tax=Puccinia striiformis f. sp. tritici TaxID=168172 RepID=A0ACC0DUD7_9BASI|nr:hypothetical protein MJO28_014763 [Puccinia striiformis f. sp. tritici]
MNSDQSTSGDAVDSPSSRPVSNPVDDSDLRYKISFKTDLAEAFEAITTSGTFAAWEALPTTPPTGLVVDGVGEIAMPMGTEQVRQLIAKSHQAPFGRRSKTLVDVSVRNTWQVNGDQLRFLDPAWQGYLVDLSKCVATNLGIEGPIRTELYKMLIYEQGAMFKPHTDTEKIPGMFGTMIICLPSAHTGGEVVVTHNGERKILKTSDASQSYACWYSDVTHEVLPVTSGYRCVLTYNLAIQPGFTQPAASALGSHKELLRKTLKVWLKEEHYRRGGWSTRFYALKHEYTQASISLPALKAEDFARVQAVHDLTAELPFVAFLALLEKGDQGFLHPDEDCDTEDENVYDDSDLDDGPHYALEEVEETDYIVKSLHALDGATIAENFPLEMFMLLQQDPFLDLAVTRESFQGHTGNEGPRATHWYRRSAVVLIPHEGLADYLARCITGHAYHAPSEENIHSVLSYLGKMSSLASFQKPVLDALNEEYNHWDHGRFHPPMKDILTVALRYSHYELFKTVGGKHRGGLPANFFRWAKRWLNTLPAADRAEKYNSWIPLLIRGFPSKYKRRDIIKIMSSRTGVAAVADGEPRSDAWAEDLIRECGNL